MSNDAKIKSVSIAVIVGVGAITAGSAAEGARADNASLSPQNEARVATKNGNQKKVLKFLTAETFASNPAVLQIVNGEQGATDEDTREPYGVGNADETDTSSDEG